MEKRTVTLARRPLLQSLRQNNREPQFSSCAGSSVLFWYVCAAAATLPLPSPLPPPLFLCTLLSRSLTKPSNRDSQKNLTPPPPPLSASKYNTPTPTPPLTHTHTHTICVARTDQAKVSFTEYKSDTGASKQPFMTPATSPCRCHGVLNVFQRFNVILTWINSQVLHISGLGNFTRD